MTAAASPRVELPMGLLLFLAIVISAAVALVFGILDVAVGAMGWGAFALLVVAVLGLLLACFDSRPPESAPPALETPRDRPKSGG